MIWLISQYIDLLKKDIRITLQLKISPITVSPLTRSESISIVC
jgi:hypothetical protein